MVSFKEFRLVQQYVLALYSGSICIVQGISGSGKTTWIKALLGHIQGMVIDGGQPRNFKHLMVNCFQEFRDQLPIREVRLMDLFPKCSADQIREYLALCCVPDLVARLGGIDIPLKKGGNISGGQKQRLGLATCVARMEREHKRVFVVDEPEQGSDHEIAVQCITANVRRLQAQGKIVIMVTHLCECVIGKLPVTHRVNVSDGVVTVGTDEMV